MANISKKSVLYRTVVLNVCFAALVTFSIGSYLLFEQVFGLMLSAHPAEAWAFITAAGTFGITLGNIIEPIFIHLGLEEEKDG